MLFTLILLIPSGIIFKKFKDIDRPWIGGIFAAFSYAFLNATILELRSIVATANTYSYEAVSPVSYWLVLAGGAICFALICLCIFVYNKCRENDYAYAQEIASKKPSLDDKPEEAPHTESETATDEPDEDAELRRAMMAKLDSEDE